MKILASQLGPPWFRYNPWKIRPYILREQGCLITPYYWLDFSWGYLHHGGPSWLVIRVVMNWKQLGCLQRNSLGFFGDEDMGPPLRIRLVKGGKPIFTPFLSRPSLRWGDENDQNEPTKTTYAGKLWQPILPVGSVKMMDTPLKTNGCPLKINGWFRCIAYSNSPFLGDMLVFGGVFFLNLSGLWVAWVNPPWGLKRLKVREGEGSKLLKCWSRRLCLKICMGH